jgi:hypothetical protein
MKRWRTWLVSVVVVLGLAVAWYFGRSPMVDACHMDGDGAGACMFTNVGSVPTSVCVRIDVGLAGDEMLPKLGGITAKIKAGTATSDEIERGKELMALAQEITTRLGTGELTANPTTHQVVPKVGGASVTTLCSGLVWPHSSTSVPFLIAEVGSMCSPGIRSRLSWQDVCSYSFFAK